MAAERFNPPMFNGTEQQNINVWTTVYNRFAETNTWDAAKKMEVLPHFLTGEALAWYVARSQQANPPNSWNEWEQELKLKFTPPEALRHARLEQRMLQPHETIEAYIADILSSCQTVDPNMTNSLKVHHLIKGFPPTMKKDYDLKPTRRPREIQKHYPTAGNTTHSICTLRGFGDRQQEGVNYAGRHHEAVRTVGGSDSTVRKPSSKATTHSNTHRQTNLLVMRQTWTSR